jgi:anti-sigma regulatory factor (Ser/Thr protein kinase)
MTVSAIARPKGRPGYTQTMPCAAESAGPARSLVRTALCAWGAEHLANDGALIVTELVANAAQHTSGHVIRVSISRLASNVFRVEVVDRSRRLPERREADPLGERGRGLAMVDDITERWGTDLLPFGKRVWGVLNGDTE